VQDFGFTEEQKQYLEGYIAALVKKRSAELTTVSSSVRANAQTSGIGTPDLRLRDPAFIHIEAQDRWVETGGKLVPEELAKRAKHPFDMWDEMLANAAAGLFPKGPDIFLHKFHGLFYVAPNQDSFMLRLRLPGGIVSSHQAKGLSSVAERFGGGYLHVTTRANLQIR
jgi:ferredoxin-nitrite reductase